MIHTWVAFQNRPKKQKPNLLDRLEGFYYTK